MSNTKVKHRTVNLLASSIFITEFDAVIFLRCLVIAVVQHARVCNMVAMFKHNDQTSKSNIDLRIYIIV